MQGDLARVVSITEGGAKALIQAVPRPDYTIKSKGTTPSFLSSDHASFHAFIVVMMKVTSLIITIITDDAGARVTGKARPSQRMLSLDDVRTHRTVQCGLAYSSIFVLLNLTAFSIFLFLLHFSSFLLS